MNAAKSDHQDSRIVLASASPRRLELCRQLGLECAVLPVALDETPLTGEAALDFVTRMAREKAAAGAANLDATWSDLPVLGSDTIVEIDGEILGKPADKEHARQMLARLSGRRHRVHTAVAIAFQGNMHEVLSSSEVGFAELSERQIVRYIATGEPMDKAGAYAIQGKAARFVSRLEGSYSGVMGLPLYETSQLFATCGIEL